MYYSGKLRYFYVALFILCFIFNGQCQNTIQFKILDTDQGLPDGTVYKVLSDSKGYLWIATSKGLSRYNGYNFTTFKPEPGNNRSISGERINTLAEDKEGNIWIGTNNNGLCVYNWHSGLFTRYFHDSQTGTISSNTINKILVDPEGVVWVGTTNGLDRFNKQDQNFDRVLDQRSITAIAARKGSTVWVNSNDGGIDRLDTRNGHLTHFSLENKKQSLDIRTIYLDKRENVWVGVVGKGVYRFNQNLSTFTLLDTNQGSKGLHSKIITSLYQDTANRLWIGTDGGGVVLYDLSSNQYELLQKDPYEPESLSSNAVLSIDGDETGNVWVGTFRYGVNQYNANRKKFNSFSKKVDDDNSLSHNSVIAMYKSNQGGIWLGTDGGGLNHFNPEDQTFTKYYHDPQDSRSITSNVIKSVYEDKDGIVWLGSYLGGLSKLDPSTGISKGYKHDESNPVSIGSDLVWAIYEDKRNNLWLGLLNSGLALFDRENETFKNFKHDPNDPTSVASTNVFTMLEDSKGNFWVGTEFGGLSLMDRQTGKFKTYQHTENDQNSIPSNEIRALFEDKDQNLWVGTKDGICFYDYKNQGFIFPDVNERLVDLVINGIQEDRSGNLWISSEKGIARYNHKTGEVSHYDKNDGLQGNVFNYTSSAMLDDGSMYFGGLNGFTTFHPNRIGENSLDPNVDIVGFRVFDELKSQHDTINGRKILNAALPFLEEVTLTHRENVFSIEFASLDYMSPSRNKYQYILEGFNDSWIKADASNRVASYMNLDAGTYTFKVKGTNSDGKWSSDEVELLIHVLPAWWETWWFRLSVVLVTCSLLTAIYLYRRNILRDQRNMEESLRTQRQHELKKMVTFLKKNSELLSQTGNNLKSKSGQLAVDAKTQNETAQLIESDIENVNNHTKKNSENASLTNSISESTVKELEKIRDATLVNIKEIEAISDEIAMLEEIFNQTNILSINASIEAARAGAYGGGFGVIASEVRKLAQKSKTASQQIVASASKGVAETRKVGELILNFIPEVEHAANLVKQISTSSNDQNDSIESIVFSLREFFQISRKQSNISEEIHSISSELEKLANQLNLQVSEIESEV